MMPKPLCTCPANIRGEITTPDPKCRLHGEGPFGPGDGEEPSSMLAEARIILELAEILEGFNPETQCRIMAAAATMLGHYDHAIRLAMQARELQRIG